ncbi:GNAT family N-acetyltransferase [Paenibacillus sp. M1]|uniref:GNAT family N-acetyltransferase n=1 Tax=Paenibacillus haidiansis TaxID=1574488 RepID=A0ABU7VR11_9BACL
MISVKPIRYEDLSELCLLYNELMNSTTNYDKLVETYRKIGENDDYILLGAYNDDGLAGSLMGIVCEDLVGECKPFMVIENVIVSPKARRQGVATQLMLEIEDVARKRDCGYIIFVSGGQRKEAHRLYEKLGYKDESVEGFRKHLH